ncbi:unnamed protein product, partial [Owenia fusiformis]
RHTKTKMAQSEVRTSLDQEVLYEKDGVFLHTTISSAENDDTLIPGRLFLIKRAEGVFIDWKPEQNVQDLNKTDEWTVVNHTVGYKSDSGSVSMKSPVKHKHIITFNISDLKSFKRSSQQLGWSYLIFILQDGTTFPALHFHQGGTKALIKEMEKTLSIKKSNNDSKLYIVREHDPQALSKSFDELQLFTDHSQDIVSKIIKDPVGATLGGFAKVTKLLHDTLIAAETQANGNGAGADDFSDLSLSLRQHDDTDIPGIQTSEQDEPGFEVVTRTELPPRPTVTRSEPLSPQEWTKHMDKDGVVLDQDKLKQIIFRGGVDKTIRLEVWKFLLGYYKWDSTYKSRTEERKTKVDDYFRMKLQWKTISEAQERNFSALKERKGLIDKDVTRTDRTHPFFQGENNPSIQMLNDILMTYCMYNFDLGYVQGMSDLLAPILVVMENEVDAFWCFVGYMDLVHSNFELSQEGMKGQLNDTHTLLNLMDPALCNYLESHESSNMYFCFRWLLIQFKREFSFEDIMRLWEVLWTGLPCKNYHLLICLAILDTEKATIMDNRFGFTEILKHINDLSLTIRLDDILPLAEAMHIQLAQLASENKLKNSIREIIGLAPEPKNTSDSPDGDDTPNGTPKLKKKKMDLLIKAQENISRDATQKSSSGSEQSSGNATAVTTPGSGSSSELLLDMDTAFIL